MSDDTAVNCTPLFHSGRFCRCSRQTRALLLLVCIRIAAVQPRPLRLQEAQAGEESKGLNSHAVLQVGSGLTDILFTRRDDSHIAYDPNSSLRRQLDQTASFGIQMEITD